MNDNTKLSYAAARALLLERLTERAPSRIQLLTGPRQVGKTTLLLELAARFEHAAIYAAADSPEALLPGFWERLWTRAETAARRDLAVVLIDEAHVLPDWARRLKGEWDRVRRLGLRVHVVATGSSALQLARSSRESLAGRFERATLTHWTARALVDAFAVSEDDAVETIVRRGGYPGAFALRNDAPRWRAYVRDAIIEPAIGRDILGLADVRRPALLRQVFGVAVTAPAQIVSLQKIQGQLQDAGALETIAHYLALLEDAYLVAALPKHAASSLRQRAAPPKLVPLSNAFVAALALDGPHEDERRRGAWIENACLAHAWNAGQQIRYWREEPLEVDAVLDGSWGRWAIEVKTGRFDAADLRGLTTFVGRFRGYQPLLLCDAEQLDAARRLGVPAMSWRAFLLDRPRLGNG